MFALYFQTHSLHIFNINSKMRCISTYLVIFCSNYQLILDTLSRHVNIGLIQ
ncbi:Uncharacterised protein [Vibrio furnissii]|nr:Uncharacterised protein [Vibrio furnissii]